MGKWFLGDAERHRPFHTRSIALALAILITFGLFSPLCVAATPSYEIDSGNIVGSQNIGTLNGYNLYLVNISKQYDTIKLQEGNDSSTGELVSFLYGDGDYDGITGGSITRNSTNFKKTATYFQKEKSNISAVTFSEQSDYLLCRLTEFDWVVTFAPVTVGYILIAWEKAASVDKRPSTQRLLKPRTKIPATAKQKKTDTMPEQRQSVKKASGQISRPHLPVQNRSMKIQLQHSSR